MCFSLLCFAAKAQTKISGSILGLLNAEVEKISGISGNSYQQPDQTSMTTWTQIMDKIAKQELTDVEDLASSLDYEWLEVSDNSSGETKTYYMLVKTSEGENYWGTYCFNFSSGCAQKVIVQSPHPIADSNTGKQGVFAFVNSGVYAFFLSGTHRCNNNTQSSCSGTTSVCAGASEPYKISDMAHETNSPFQRATEIIAEQVANTVFIQLHGFSKRDTDPYVIMSNGTKETSTVDYVVPLKNSLSDIDGTLTFQIGHVNTDWTRLLGTTNTQGRFINGSSNPCTEAATQASGGFIHFEQEFSKLREDETGWTTLSRALVTTFGCPVNTVTSLSKGPDTAGIDIFPNPFDKTIYIKGSYPKNARFKLVNQVGQVFFNGVITAEQTIDTSWLGIPGFYYLIVEHDSKVILTKRLLKQI